MLARRLDPGRYPPSHPANHGLFGRWSAGTLTAGRRPGSSLLIGSAYQETQNTIVKA